MMRRAVKALALLGAAILGACISGSETGNPTKGLTGRIRTLDGLPAARARVKLVPAGYVPADPHAVAEFVDELVDNLAHYFG